MYPVIFQLLRRKRYCYSPDAVCGYFIVCLLFLPLHIIIYYIIIRITIRILCCCINVLYYYFYFGSVDACIKNDPEKILDELGVNKTLRWVKILKEKKTKNGERYRVLSKVVLF